MLEEAAAGTRRVDVLWPKRLPCRIGGGQGNDDRRLPPHSSITDPTFIRSDEPRTSFKRSPATVPKLSMKFNVV
jgi:hypothetical protein